MLCSGILTGCDVLNRSEAIISDGSNTPSIRPHKIDMTEVHGFAIAENTSYNPSTKADNDGDGWDDETGEVIENMPNGGAVVNTSPYSLYTIDENGELHLSIFYFEVVEANGDNGKTDITQTQRELSNALQIVPSLITDFGKYILFSNCQFAINDADMSQNALEICENFIRFMPDPEYCNITYLIRKSDGALFDVTDMTGRNSYFTYREFWDKTGLVNAFTEIPSDSYTTSVQGNIFTRSDWPRGIYKFVDDGDAIDISLVTQIGKMDGEHFCVDKDENIYVKSPEKCYIDIYYGNGKGFNMIEVSDDCYYNLLQFFTDKAGNPYIVTKAKEDVLHSETDENGNIINEYHDTYEYFKIWKIDESGVSEIAKIQLDKDFWWGTYFHNDDGDEINALWHEGWNGNKLVWVWQVRTPDDKNAKCVFTFTYDPDTKELLAARPSDEIQAVINNSEKLICGKKCHAATIKNNKVEVHEFDILEGSLRTYSLDVDLSAIIMTGSTITKFQGFPYLMIYGRHKTNGTDVRIMINLINGENNSTFSSDSRNVVSFFRIN